MKATAIPSKGKLEEYSVNRLLQMLSEESLSGCLTVSRGNTRRSIYVREGTLVYATSNAVHDRLGEVFIVQGKLSRNVVDAAFKKGKRLKTQLGMILLVDGHINAQDLFQGVTAQVIAILERMRSWRKGNFTFKKKQAPEPGTVLMHIPLGLYLGSAGKAGAKTEPPAKSVKKKKSPRKKKKEALELDEDALAAIAEAAVEASPGEDTPVEAAPVEETSVEETPEREAVPEEEAAEGIGWHEIDFKEEREAEELAPPATDPGDFPDGGLDVPAVPGAESEGGFAKDDARIIEEIVFQVQELRRRAERGPHVLLGVNVSASAAEVHEAYHYLAKLLHPDSRPPGLPEDTARDAEEMLKIVIGAYGEVSAAREAQEAAGSEAPPPAGRVRAGTEAAVDRGEASRQLFFRAKEYIAKGNYWQAADSMRQAVRMKPRDALYRNLLGFCLMQTGRRLHEAEEHIREAVRLDPGNPDYITNLGLVYKAGRFFKKAREMFLQALVYDKKHQLARQELKKLPREAEQSKNNRSFWQKLRGR